LDPRPDTETLIEAALKRFKGNPPRKILDLGTGSGCILITLLSEWPQAQGVGVDISPAALDVARENAQINGIASRARFICGDWGEGLDESFDLIVSNPPYIPTQDIETLEKGVRNHDPTRALDGGADGLEAYKAILMAIKKLFSTDGAGFFEIGFSQAQEVARLVANAGFSVRETHPDLAGIQRVVEFDLGKTSQ
jgi:release factor glutamine methyltransferase